MQNQIWTSEKFPQYAIDEVENTVNTILEFNSTVDRLGIIRLFVKNAKSESLRGGWNNDTSLRYAVSQLPESERESFYPVVKEVKFQTKSQPIGFSKICSKCSGSGLYVQWIENGKACSRTGTTCYKCSGRGWTK